MSYPAEAQIAREIMQFAVTDQLYRGSKPVMWSVVEKTSARRGRDRIQDYQSDMIWAGFPVRATSDSALKTASVVIWTTTPWTIPGNRAICFNGKVAYGLYEVSANERDFGPKVGAPRLYSRRQAGRSRRRTRRRSRWCARPTSRATCWRASPAPTRSRARAMISTSPCSKATMSPTTPAPASSIPRPAMAARTSTSGPPPPRSRCCSAADRHEDPLHRRWRRLLHRRSARLRGQARHHRQGREGRRQRGRHQGAHRRGQAGRARAAEAPVSAFLALQEAGDLPQHAAMVHPHGQAALGGGHAALRRPPVQPGSASENPSLRDLAGGDPPHAMGAAAGREPHHRHDRGEARTGSSPASAPGACRSPSSSTRRRVRS